jgi:hypothetical protein
LIVNRPASVNVPPFAKVRPHPLWKVLLLPFAKFVVPPNVDVEPEFHVAAAPL